jgi:hypothetical protein
MDTPYRTRSVYACRGGARFVVCARIRFVNVEYTICLFVVFDMCICRIRYVYWYSICLFDGRVQTECVLINIIFKIDIHNCSYTI